MKPFIHVKQLEVNSIANSSGIFYGENEIYKFEGVSSSFEGFGSIQGDFNAITNTKNSLVTHNNKNGNC